MRNYEVLATMFERKYENLPRRKWFCIGVYHKIIISLASGNMGFRRTLWIALTRFDVYASWIGTRARRRPRWLQSDTLGTRRILALGEVRMSPSGLVVEWYGFVAIFLRSWELPKARLLHPDYKISANHAIGMTRVADCRRDAGQQP